MKQIFLRDCEKMAHPETGGVRTTEDESEKLETSSDDEEITIPSQDKAEVRNLDIRDEHSENTQREDYYLRSPGMGLARDRLVRSTRRL